MCWLWLAAAGAIGALAFPFTAPLWGTLPLADAAPRELLVAAPVMALYWVTQTPWRRRMRTFAAWWVGVWFFAPLIGWLDIAMCRYGGMPQGLALPLLATLIGFCALFWALVPWLCERLVALGCSSPVALATAMVAVDWLRGEGAGFPWGWLGYSQARHLPLAQLAAVGGVSLVTWWVVCAAAVLWQAWQKRPVRWRCGVALLLLYALGCTLWVRPWPAGAPLRVAVVQGNIEQDLKNSAVTGDVEIIGVYHRLSSQAVAAGADWVVWPEAALPGYIDASEPLPWELRLDVPLLFGAATYEPGHPVDTVRNSAIFMAPDGQTWGRYDKRHLVPFGEYVPLRWLLPIDRLVPGTLDITPGTDAALLGPNADIGALVCYDGVFTAFARDAVRAGAQLLVNFTNDAWYGISGAPYQHRDFYVFRAIESGRWVVRATNTGVSLFIDPRGGQHGATALGTRALGWGTVSRQVSRTIFVRCGDWWMAACIGMCLAALVRPRSVC